MKTNFIILFLLVALGASVFWGGRATNGRNHGQQEDKEIAQQFDKAFGDLVQTAALPVDFNGRVWVDEELDTISFPKGKPRMFGIYLNDVQCVECQLDALRLLKAYRDSIGENNMVVFSNYHNMNELSILKNRAEIDMPVMNTAGRLFPDRVYNAGTPYLFIIDSSLTIRSLFMHNKAMPRVSERYLGSVGRILAKR